VQPNAPGTQGYNLYTYVANNPTTWVDPSGHTHDQGHCRQIIRMIVGFMIQITGAYIMAMLFGCPASGEPLCRSIVSGRYVTVMLVLLGWLLNTILECYVDGYRVASAALGSGATVPEWTLTWAATGFPSTPRAAGASSGG
jgi:hypothetical protein